MESEAWFANYLDDRTQFPEICNSKSRQNKLTTGVPQGSILGTILFLIYINDIQNCTNKLTILSFADDTTVYISNPNVDEMVDIVNTELKKLYDWLCAHTIFEHKKNELLCIQSHKQQT